MWVPANVCGCCEDPFTICFLTIIVIFVICFGIVKPIANAGSQEDNREKEEYSERQKWKSIPYCPGMPWKYRRKRHEQKSEINQLYKCICKKTQRVFSPCDELQFFFVKELDFYKITFNKKVYGRL